MLNYLSLLESVRPSILIVTGPSGTGKTMNACKVGQARVKRGDFSKIVLTRPAITASGEDHGFLPGTLDEKMAPWVRPSMEYLGTVKPEFCPLGFMRGRTFERSWIIADEMQNSTKQQMLMLLTRIGYGSKLLITGDTDQTDLLGGVSGLSDLIDRMIPSDEIQHVKLDAVKRHPVINQVLKMYATK